MEYMCPEHPLQNFANREMYSEHLAKQHSESQDKLSELDEIDKNAQLVPAPQSGCPLCSYEAETWAEMDKHLAFHLETLALLSLPLATGLERDDASMRSTQLEGGEDDAMQLLDGDDARVLSSRLETEGESVDEDGNKLPQGEKITLAALQDLDSKTLALASEDTVRLWDATTGSLQKTLNDAKDCPHDRTPLSWAAENGDTDVVKLLLDTGEVDVDAKNVQNGRTALSYAAESGHVAVVKSLLETGRVDVDAKDRQNRRTALSYAAQNGHEAVVKLLLNTGKVDVDIKDIQHGRTALLYASENGHEAVVKLLLESGKIDAERTTLSWAADNGHEALYSQLHSSLLDSALSLQKFLPLDVLDATITEESVRIYLPWNIRLFQPDLLVKVTQDAKRVFAILVLLGETLAIKELLSEGITDDHLPLSRSVEATNSNILMSEDGKCFRSFAAWENDTKVEDFLIKQWLVLAPVLDTRGRLFMLNKKCPLPFVEAEEIGAGPFGIVYRGVLHPAHQKGFQVSSFFVLSSNQRLR
jgi:hypothetical protein